MTKMTKHKMTEVIVVPESILAPCDTGVRARRATEYRIVHRVITDLLAAGFELRIDHDSENEPITINSADEEQMAEMFACDEETLYVRREGKRFGWVRFVYGNEGWDVVSDHSTNLEEMLKDALKYAETMA